ncbi:MAG: 1-acyl-sn-glycerol-3-phosphate acyltransferase [Lachnospiraceae bacterium]|nr:1-acyl-sn-glycerol-3-phosphate acyltransferase [Lachnospiraceae bacterium]
MLRFYYVIGISIPLIIYYILMASHYYKHSEKYDEEACFRLALCLVKDVMRRARIRIVAYGMEHLPKTGGYIMYSNHQGKFDALGIMQAHGKPCSVVMDAKRSKMILVDSIINLVRGVRLERNNFKQQLKELDRLTKEASQGRKFIYFPEGGYEHNGNTLQEFRAGAFKCSLKAKCPIVPVAIYDSYIPFEINSLRLVTTQICFMEPIPYEDYCHMNTQEISKMVKGLIEEKIKWLENNRRENGFNKWVERIEQRVG